MDADTIGLSELPADVADWSDARDSDASYQALTDEIARMSSMTESTAAPPDWGLVEKSGTDILLNKAKDIQIAAYTAVAMTNTKGMEGFSRGIKILGDILSTYSDVAFPPKKRKRARINAVDWWLERAVSWLENAPSSEIPYEFSQDLGERITTLDEALTANFEDDAPLLSELKSRVQMIPVAAPPPDPEEIAEVEIVDGEEASDADGGAAASSRRTPVQQASSSATSAATSIAGPKTVEEAKRAVGGFLSSAVAAAELAAESNSDPLPYRLRRVAAWSSVKGAPPAEDGKTMLPAPESHVVQALNSLLDSSDFSGALKLAEEQVGVYLFWLDPHRVTAQALSGLGQSHRVALKAVELEVEYYLFRFPALPKLAFTDGTPFADPRTRAWLAELGNRGGGGGGAEENPELKKALDKARETAATNPEESLGVLSAAAGVSGHPRDHLLLRVEVLKTFVSAGRMEAAKAQIPAITDVLDRFNLDIWDPPLASQALAAALSALAGDDDATLQETLRRRLALSSPIHYFRSV